MKKNNKQLIYVFLFFIFLTIVLFFKFFFNGMSPFPGDYLLAWYQPWSTYYSTGTTITIAHKAIADDVFRQLFIYKELIAQMLTQQELPFWNPYNGAGMPFLATMHAGILTPFNLLFLLLPGFLAWGFYIALQPILVGIFTYVYCRKIQLSFLASLFASTTFTLSGFIITRLIFGEYIYVVAGLPLLLYLIELFSKNQNTKLIFLIPFIIFFLYISGQPQIILYVLLISICSILTKYHSFGIKKSLELFFLYVIGLGLSAMQLFPTIELFLHASISPTSSKFIFTTFLLPFQHIVTILIPNYFGNQATYNYWGSGDYIETVASVGIIPVFFALLSFVNKEKTEQKIKLFYLLVIIISIFSTISWPGSKMFFSLPIPILSTGVPSRIFVLTTFSIAILAGYGFDSFLQQTIRIKRILFPTGLFTFLIALLWLVTFLLYKNHVSCGINVTITECRLVALRNTTLEVLPFFLELILFFVFLLKKKKIFLWIPYFFLLCITVLGLYNANKFLPFSPKNTFFPSNPLMHFLSMHTGYDRVFGFDQANIKTDFASHFHYYDPQYYDPLYNKRYGELIMFANRGSLLPVLPRSDVEIINQATLSAQIQQRRQRLFDLLGVKYFIYKKSESGLQPHGIWEDTTWMVTVNTSVLPHAYFVTSVMVKPHDKALLMTLFSKSFDPKTTAIIEKPLVPALPQTPTPFFSEVHIIRYQATSITITTSSNKPAFFVLSDNYYPDWHASIDGKATQIYRADYSLRGIAVPQGKHVIIFSYQPQSFTMGLITSLLFLVILNIWFFKRRRY